jgi:hypothetical protein
VRGSVLSNHKVPNYLVERVLLDHTGNLQWTDNLDESVTATVTSDLAHPREGDDATYHPIEHHKTSTFPYINRLGSHREASHEKKF